MTSTLSWRDSRAQRGWRGFSDRGRTEATHLPTPSPSRGEILLELKQENIPQSTHDSKIRDCKYVASYSWLGRENPTIVIPGKPPVWNPPVTPRRLEQDKGDFFRDQNAARYPSYPIEPAVQAVLKLQKQFPTKDIDIFTCSSALSSLFRFVQGEEREFRTIVAKVGHTVFFIRREKSPTELIPNVKGHGHTFPEEYTSWEKDAKGSVSHQRIIQYEFGGLRLLVRFGVDGYHREEEGTAPDPELDETSLVDAFGTTSVGHAWAVGQKSLQIKQGGQSVPQNAIFDIKTRSVFDFKTQTIKKKIDTADILPRLYMSQIPTLLVGFHDRGLFEDIRVMDMRQTIREWEESNAERLHQLASLLHDIIEFARTSQTNLEICRSGSGPLEIRRLADKGLDALPPELKARWAADPEVQTSSPQDEDPDSDKDAHNDLWDSDSGVYDDGRESDDESVKDYTACSAEDCGYCGHCRY